MTKRKDCMTFGKYKGQPIPEIWRKDRKYLQWIYLSKLKSPPFHQRGGTDHIFVQLTNFFLRKNLDKLENNDSSYELLSNDEVNAIPLIEILEKDPELFAAAYRKSWKNHKLGWSDQHFKNICEVVKTLTSIR